MKTYKGTVTKLVENKGRLFATLTTEDKTSLFFVSDTEKLFAGKTIKEKDKVTIQCTLTLKDGKPYWTKPEKVTFQTTKKNPVKTSVYGRIEKVEAGSDKKITKLHLLGLNKTDEGELHVVTIAPTIKFSDKIELGKRVKLSLTDGVAKGNAQVYEDDRKVNINTTLFKMVVGMLWKVAFSRVTFKQDDFSATTQCVIDMYEVVEELKGKLIETYPDRDVKDIGAKVGSNLELVVSSLKAKDKKDFNLILELTEKAVIANIQTEVAVGEYLTSKATTKTVKPAVKKVEDAKEFEDDTDQGIVDL